MNSIEETRPLTQASLVSSTNHNNYHILNEDSQDTALYIPVHTLTNKSTQRNQPLQQQNSQESNESLDLGTPTRNFLSSGSSQTVLYSAVPAVQNTVNFDSTIIRVENNPQDTTEEGSYEAVDLRGKALTQIHLVKELILSGALILALVWVLLMPSFDYLVAPIYGIILGYMVTLCILDSFWTSSVTAESWPDNIYGMKFVDAFCAAACALMFGLKFLDIFPGFKFAGMPFIISLIYAACNYQALPHCTLEIFVRIYYILQMVFLTLRLDGLIRWDWNLVLLPSLLYALFAKGSIVVFAITMKKKMRESSMNLPRPTKVIGLIWHLACYSCFVFPLVISVLGIAQALTSTNKFQVLSIVAYIGIALNTIQIVFTLVAWKHVMKFLIKYEMICPQNIIMVDGALKVMSFQVEKKESYFVKISPTYYIPLEKSFSTKDKQNISQIKSTLQKVKLSKLRNKDSHVDLVEPLNKSLTDLERPDQETPSQEADEKRAKFAHSLNDIDEFAKSSSTEASSNDNEDENLCCICYRNTSDVIMANCGHGGVCYDCAVPLIRKKDKCLVCREKVDALQKIDPNPKFLNIVKGLELSKIVIS